MPSQAAKQARIRVLTIYLLLVACILLADGMWQPALDAGAQLYFISDSDAIDAGRGVNAIYRIGLDGQGLQRVLGAIPHGEGYLRTTAVACQAASGSLLIASHQSDLDGFHHARLDGTGLHLDQPAAGEHLKALRDIALAADGMSVLAARPALEMPTPRFGLVVGDLLKRDFRLIKAPSYERSYESPVWSPDGSQIAYVITRQQAQGADYALAIARPDGSQERLILESALAISDIDWSPAGAWLALEMGGQVYKIKADGSALTRLSDHQGGASGPRWSPDGGWISFVSRSSFPGFKQLMRMDAAGGGISQIANIQGDVVNGCWVQGAPG